MQTAVATCRARHGWSEVQARHASLVALYTARLMTAARALRAAGVDMDALGRVYRTFEPADLALLGRPGMGGPESLARLGDLIADRTREAGIRAESGPLVDYFAYRAGIEREARLVVEGE
jgi:hypothetical protein